MKKDLSLLALGFAAMVPTQGLSAQEQGAPVLKGPDGKPMNVIYIMADDLGYGDLGCYGQKKIETPHIDRMAKQGIRFTQAYAGCTVSAPSRASLMTGLHTGHTHVRGNKEIQPEGQEPLGPMGTQTLGTLFKNANYATGLFGKWGLGYPGSDAVPEKMGFDQFFGYNCQRQAHYYFPEHLWWNNKPYIFLENYNDKRETYSADQIHFRAMQFLEAHRDQPFFLMLSYTLPHAELNMPHNEFYKKYENAFPEQKPYHGGYPDSEKPYTNFAGMVSQLDAYVGDVLARVKALGIDRHTLIIFTSDNGPHREGGANPDYFNSGGPLRGIKRDLTEGGIRVPFITYCPGVVPAGKTSGAILAFWDLMPSFAALLGHPLSNDIDGVNVLPALLGEADSSPERTLYWEFHEDGGKQAIRKGPWKLIRTKIYSEKPSLQLFNLDSDLHEDRDLSQQQPILLKRLEAEMDGMRSQSDLFPFPAYISSKKE